MLSVNYTAYSLIKEVLDKPEVYGVNVSKTEFGATIIDAGIERNGGYRCGEKVTEICLGGCGKAKIQFKRYGEIYLPTIFVYTDHPALATLGSQFAGWRIKHEDYFAMASGPARDLAMKPKEIYRKIGYKDEA
ncbi:MAG: methenyltetrahydromethanopterin cyclohydrolase, partial [Candidatus Bathyarchaeia archaeon]